MNRTYFSEYISINSEIKKIQIRAFTNDGAVALMENTLAS